jgi:soluble lytic murein transglycosylase-like protein
VLAWSLSIAIASVAPDPCALRSLVEKPSSELVPLVDKAKDARAKACIEVVAANSLSREGHGSAAAAMYDDASETLVDIAGFLELAKKRALAPPKSPVSDPFANLAAPKTPEECADRVQAMLRAAMPKRAADVAIACKRDPLPNEALEVATVTALMRADRVDEGLAFAAKLPASDAFTKVRAWALAKANKAKEARDLYAQLSSSTSDPALKAEAAFYAAFSSYESGDLDDAKARFIAGADAMKGSAFEGQGRWYAGLADLLRNRAQDAVPTLDALVKDLPSDREAMKHRYWLGRALLDAGDARGKKELREVASIDPTDYYALLARRRLKLKPIGGAKIAHDALAKSARDDDDAKRARLLWDLGLDDEARTAGRALGDELADIGVQQLVDDAHNGWRRGAKFIPSPRSKNGKLVDDSRWRVSYAAPWIDVVETAAKKHGIAASFVYAIMRTESGFDPRAVSVAGAQGVIQLLPAAAKGACTLAGRPTDDAARIFEAPVAIDLGTALLAAHKRDFGSLALAAAAYNGAAPNVAQWMRDFASLKSDPELFVERIPFRETRDYVKRVLAVEATYRALEGEPLAIDFPDVIPDAPAKPTHFATGD